MAQRCDRAEFLLSWQPYFLFESAPDEGMPFVEWMRNVAGEEAAGKAQRREGTLFELCDEMGLNLDADRRLGNTVYSHCLVDYAGKISPAVQTELVEVLFEGNLANGELISDINFLLRCAEKVNIDKEGALAHMQNAEIQQQIIAAYKQTVQEIGVPKLPFTVMTSNRNPELKLAFSGDMPPSTMAAIFDKLLDSSTET
eukprot:scpid56276/ scgid13301/ 